MAKFVLEFDIEPSLIKRIETAAKEQEESVTEFALELLKKKHRTHKERHRSNDNRQRHFT